MLNPETKALQERLGSYCKTGKLDGLPGSRADRLPHYRRLVRNVFYGILAKAYPIAKTLLTDNEWNMLVDDFMVNHPAQENEVWKMPRELLEYVETASYGPHLNRPYLSDLLALEWAEIEVHGMPDVPHNDWIDTPQKETGIIDLTPYGQLLTLEYPVHDRSIQHFEEHKGTYFVLVYRQKDAFDVHYMALSPFAALLIDALVAKPQNLSQALKNVCQQLNTDRTETLNAQARKFLDVLFDKGIAGVIEATKS